MKKETKPKKPLHLAKFNPAVADTPSAEGETMFIRRTTAAVAEAKIKAAPADDFGLPLKEMLGVITYCYARGVFSSGEIAELLQNEPELRKSVGARLPDEAVVRRFRRQYAAEIEEALESLYRAYPPGQDPTLPTGRASKLRSLSKRQAGYRIHDAIWTDNKLPGHPTME